MTSLDLMALGPPVRSEQVGDEPAMTFFRAGFGTKQGRSLRPGRRIECLRDSALPHQREEFDFVR